MCNGKIERFKWDSSTNSLSEEDSSLYIGYPAVGLALDPDQHYLFVTQEYYDWGGDDIYVFDALDLQTLVSSYPDVPGVCLSGIATDSERHLIYVLGRETDNLYIYSWDVDTLTFNLENDGLPVTLKNLAEQSIQTGGLAFDEKDGYLYVTEVSGHGPVSSKVYCYDVDTWLCEYEFDTGDYTPLHLG